MESEVFRTRITRKSYLPIYFLTFVVIFSAFFFAVQGTLSFTYVAAAAVIGLLSIKATEIHRLGHLYEINPFSVVHKRGYLSTHARRIDLFAISDVIITQSLIQRIFNYGHVHIRLFSIESTNTLKNIHNPLNFVNILESKMQKLRLNA